MEWLVEVVGDDSVLRRLCEACVSPEVTICEVEEDCFVLKSTDFKALENVVTVYNKACEIVELIVGATRIATGSKIGMGHVIEVDEEGKKRRHTLCSGESQIQIDLEMTMTIGDGPAFKIFNSIDQAASVPVWCAMAKKNERVEKVLRLISEGSLDFNKLNILFEEVQGDVGSKITDAKWATETEIEHFTRTAQPYRHGKSGLGGWTPPKHPLKFESAKSLVMRIIANWLKSKADEEGSTLENIEA